MTKASTLANELWPFLLPKVARVNRNGGGRVISAGGEAGSGGVDSFFELSDVEPTGWDDGDAPIWNAGLGKLVPALISGGGITYTAGNGIAISGATISTKQQSAGGIRADSNGLYLVRNSESGLKLDSNGLAVGAGNGIDVQGDLTAVHLGVTSGLTFDGSGGLVVDATLAGAGLGWDNTNKVMSVNVSEGIEYIGDAIRVDEDYSFIWDGTHRFNFAPQLNANINFIGADRTITSAAGIDLTFDLGADLILASPKTFRSADYLDDIPIAGFSLFANTGGDRQLTINTIKSDSLHTRLFVADGVRIDIGEERWGKSMGIVHDDFIVPALVGATVSVYFEDSPMLTGALFSVNDWVLFRYLNQGSNFAFGSVWGQVTSYTDMGLDADGRGYQRWTFTLRHGDAGVLVKKGNVAVDYGASGQGFAFLSVLSDAVGPWFRIGTWSGANPYTAGNTQIRTQIGNLAGISDTALNPAGYGLYSENAYLKGIIRTAETVMDDDGLTILYNDVAGVASVAGEHALLAWRVNVDDRTAAPSAHVSAGKDISSPSFHMDFVDIRARKSDDSIYSIVDLKAVNPADAGYGGAELIVDSRGYLWMWATQTNFMGHALPGTDLSYDLGSLSLRWRNLYCDHLYVTGAISGDTLSGAEWEYPGSMIIDPHGAGDLTVTIINQGAGRADLVVDRDISLGGTIDGVDISAHVANPSAHHAIATGTDGITIASGQIISVDATVVRTPATVLRTTQLLLTDAPLTGGGELGDGLTLRLLLAAIDPGLTAATGGLGVLLAAGSPGLSLTGGLAVDASIARAAVNLTAGAGLTGGGDLSVNRTFNVGAGDGITVNADDVAIDFTAVPHIGTLMIAGAGLTGGGDLSANRTFDVVAGNGSLTVSADSLVVNQGFAFAWTGAQSWAGTTTFNGAPTFNSAPQINANLAFIGADRTITASSNLTMQPAANLTLDPTGGIVYLPNDVEERSATFADLVTGIQGFRLWAPTATTRQLVIGSLKADSFTTRTFVADTVRLEQGDSYWGKGYGIVNADFVLPAVNADVNVWFDNVPNTAGNIFSVGDKLLARFIVWTTGISVKLIWFNVQAFVSADDPNFRQQWTLRRLSGGTTGDSVIKGVVCEDSGATGQGWIHVTSLSGGPYMEFGTQTSLSAGIPQFTQNVRIGQLSGTVDYASSAWGFATGNNLGIGPTAGFSGITIDNTVQGLRVFNAAYQLFNGANLILSLEKTNGLSLEFGSAAFNSIGWYEDLGTGTPSGLLGSVGAARAIAGYTELDLVAQGIAGSYSTGAVKLRGVNASAAAYNLWVDSSGVYFGTGTGARPQTGGFIQDATQYFSGNVGIGTATPRTMLDVSGTLRSTTNTTPSAGAGLEMYYVSASSYTQMNSYDRTGAVYKDFRIDGLTLALNAGSGGSVGVGTTTPWSSSAMDMGAGLLAFNSSSSGHNYIQGNLSGNFTILSYFDHLLLQGGVNDANVRPVHIRAGASFYGLFVHTNGFVGVGSAATPRSALDMGSGSLTFDSNGPGGGNTIQGNQTNLWLFRSQYDHITLQAGLNDANSRALHLRSGATLYGLFVNTNGRVSVGSSTAASTTLHVFGTTTLAGTVSTTGLITASAGATISAGDVIISAGNVGIGTPSPQRLLHIGGGGQAPSQTYEGVYVNPNATIVQMSIENSGGVEGGMFAHSNGNFYLGTWTNNPIVIRSNNADRMTITNTAVGLTASALGVGMTTPVAQLDVVNLSTTVEAARLTTSGTVDLYTMFFRRSRGTAASPSGVLNNDFLGGIGWSGYTNAGWATPNSGTIELWAVEDFNTGVSGKAGAEMYFRTKAVAAGIKTVPDVTIGAAGNVVIPYIANNALAGTAVVVTASGLLVKTTSSLRFKTDIREMPDSLGEEFVMGLRPILYRMKSDDSGLDWPGFAAEQVEELGGIPFVSYGQEGLVDSLHYERLTVPLVMTAQKQQRRIAELEARVAHLEMRLAA